MPDPIFANPRLAQLYDRFDPDRSDLDVYAAMVQEFGVHSILDVGCGTGTFACLLTSNGFSVTGVDPAEESLKVARSKPKSEDVRWIHGDATSLPPLQLELATMTANVAQVFLTDDDWLATLRGIHGALRADGRLIFETRDPSCRAWESWTPENSFQRIDVPGIGFVESFNEITDVALPLVTFRYTFSFANGGDAITSHSTLRFRERAEIEESLAASGFNVDEVRDAPDRPGREFVFICTRATRPDP